MTNADEVGFDPPYEENTFPGPSTGISLAELQSLNEWLFCPTELRATFFYFYNLACRNIPAGSWGQPVETIASILGVSPEVVLSILLRGWYQAADGRWYHPAIVRIVRKEIEHREANRQRAQRFRERLGGKKAAKPKNDAKARIPYADIVALYNEILSATNPECLAMNDTRRTRIRNLWNNDLADLERWRSFFTYVSRIPFLTGRQETPGRKPFRPNIDWLTKPENYLKIKERGYE